MTVISVDTLQPIILIAGFALLGYLFGSISAAIITCKLMGLPDPRTDGSKNPGATNVLRLGGKKAAAITLAGDMLKGMIPVAIVVLAGFSNQVIAATGIAAFLGHLYPIFYGFKGGKGVATMLGVLIGTHWIVGLGTIGIWLAMAFTFKISSLSALVATACAPALAWYVTASPAISISTAMMTVILFWRHRSNIRNLLAGKEGKIGSKK